MSFFTNDAYASFRQPQSAVQTAKPLYPPSHSSASRAAGTKTSIQEEAHRRLNNASMTSNASTASMLSELDPLSPLNVQRASDPWYGNTLPAIGATTPSSVPKVFGGDPLEDDWGEFFHGGPAANVPPPSVSKSRDARKREALPAEDCAMVHAGWSRLQNDQPTAVFDDEEELTEGGLLPYQYQYQVPSRPYQQPPSPPLPFARTLLTRLASFGSLGRPNAAQAAAFGAGRASSLGSIPISSSAAAAVLLPRNYDAYDATFEKGPIGLELETDWYGRQAVVKGFKKVNDADGLAKMCGLIRVGDVLTAINGESCLELGFQDTLARLRHVSAGKHTLHFKSLEAAGDLSIYNHDADIIQAKKFIHAHKETFYRAPPRLANSQQLIHGCVERLQGETVTAFNFHREDTGAFVLACSCVNDKTGVFVFHTLQDSHLREWKDLPMSEDSAVYLGRLVPNFVGTEFTVLDHQQKRRNELGFIEYSTNVLGRVPNFLKVAFPKQPHLQGDDGYNEEEEDDDEVVEVELRPRAATADAVHTRSGRHEDNAVLRTFATTMMDRNGTISERYKRRFQTRGLSLVERLRSFSLDDIEVGLPFGGSGLSTLAAAWHDDDDHAGRARAMRLQQQRMRGVAPHSRVSLTPYSAVEQQEYDCDLICFETRKPSWNDELGAWTLNFQGRVKLASKKNFLVVAEQGNDAMEAEFGEDTTYLRFGKVTKSTFALDYKAPLSPLLALAIACSAFASKRAVT